MQGDDCGGWLLQVEGVAGHLTGAGLPFLLTLYAMHLVRGRHHQLQQLARAGEYEGLVAGGKARTKTYSTV